MTFKGVRLGVTVCEDIWNDAEFWPRRLYPRDPIAELADAGAEIFVNISSSPFTIGKASLRREMIRQQAIKHGRPFLYVNQVGGNDELIFDGHSTGFAGDGTLLVRARRLRRGLRRRSISTRPERHRRRWSSATVSASRDEEAWKALAARARAITRASAASATWCSACRAASIRR